MQEIVKEILTYFLPFVQGLLFMTAGVGCCWFGHRMGQTCYNKK